LSGVLPPTRANTLRASSKGQAFAAAAKSRSLVMIRSVAVPRQTRADQDWMEA
jgi:hypothetical protein